MTPHAAKIKSGCVRFRLASLSSKNNATRSGGLSSEKKKNDVMCWRLQGKKISDKTVPLPLLHILLPSTCALPALRASSCADSVDQLTGDFWDRSHC